MRALPVLALAAWLSTEPRPAPAVGARRDFIATDSTLSLLEPSGARCVWAKLDAVTHQRLAIATLDGDCRGGEIALSVDQKRGLVWFDPRATGASLSRHGGAFPEARPPAGARPRLFAVDLDTGTATSRPLPPGTSDLGFDPQGRMIALTIQEPTPAESEKGEVLVDGVAVKLEPAAAGVRVLVHAFAFTGGAWKRFETASSTTGWNDAEGVTALTAAQDLAFRSAEVLVARVQGDREVDQALLEKLAGFAPQARPTDQDGWIRFGSGDTRFVLWEVSGELTASTGLAAFVDATGRPVKPASWPYTEKDLVTYRWNGEYLLATLGSLGSHPRLYRRGKLAWSSDAAQAVTFWPQPRRPAARAARTHSMSSRWCCSCSSRR